MLISLIAVSQIKNITIAEKGKDPNYKIMVPSSTLKCWKTAANELKSGIQKITGVELPIVEHSEALNGNYILIGPTKYTSELTTLKINDLKVDGYEIRFAQEKHLIINGGSRGVIYGCLKLLEDFGNCRFMTSWMMIYPPSNTFQVDSSVDIYEIADVFWRSISIPDSIPSIYLRENYKPWDYNGDTVQCSYCLQTFPELLSPDLHPNNKFPEYWALLPNGARSTSAPCLTNSGAFDVIVNNILNRMKVYPNSLYIDIGHWNTQDYCHCANCAARMKLYGDIYSGLFVEFCNNVSKIVKQHDPTKIVRCLAYLHTTFAPINIKMNENVEVYFAHLGQDNAHPLNNSITFSNMEFKRELDKWLNVSQHFHVYEYLTNFYLPMLIHPIYHSVSENIKYYYNKGMIGYTQEDSGAHSDMTYFKHYVISKMLFYPDGNETYFENDFLYHFYGAGAASYIRKFLDVTKKATENDPDYYIPNDYGMVPNYLTESYLNYANWLWQKAVDAAKKEGDEKKIFNTEMGQIPSMYSYFYYTLYNSTYKLIEKNGKVFIDNEKITEYCRKILERCPEDKSADKYTGKSCHIARKKDDPDGRLRQLKLYLEGETASTISQGNLKATATSTMSDGRVFSLTKNNVEYLDRRRGLDFGYSKSFKYVDSVNYGFSLKTSTKTNNFMEFTTSPIIKSYTIDSNSVTFKVRMTVQGKQTPVFTLCFDLGDVNDVFVKTDNNQWKRPVFPVNCTSENHYGESTKNKNSVSVCSQKTKRGITVNFPQNSKFFTFLFNKTSNTITMYLGFNYDYWDLFEEQIKVTPIENVQNLPNIPIPYSEPAQKTWFFPIFYFASSPQKNDKWNPTTDEKNTLGYSTSVAPRAQTHLWPSRDIGRATGKRDGNFTVYYLSRC
ncbi:hypothetical protein TVAG_445400 [Trichomonas vaginalis G3]|uniref:Alpha glucuronidase N-terminal domain-containing protein n=1 Tax=Trichomonas vaginalis (strain ATCC PRA-98 / G3) TaxID=412133 RepID=A2E4K6_TRIV3|nr:coagulation factor 5/8 C-terminal domain-containing protein family [Trichomonas vaginalis G3]EAY12428.1 hypothetical protein TVAG_445400 [Trichomonas vaginalis G3]KAI5494193.1 coagulation factor 5/8 C-terminal domain-containing protein family [Trichomonas vaginalis G3]|eukprot:XP_001324651.1 hypothetical protein [Trichomonas vaginalis G3]